MERRWGEPSRTGCGVPVRVSFVERGTCNEARRGTMEWRE